MLIKSIKQAFILVGALSGLTVSSLQAKDIPGSSETSYGVSASGAFQFSIPIVVPTGRNGIKPNLALSYSSSRGNGPLGVGWGVSGLSQISRCAKTIAIDGVVGAVKHNDDDQFCLNGSRLILTSGSHGQAGSIYRTEVDSFAKIQAIGNGSVDVGGGTSPSGWKVMSKDGSVFYYGSKTTASDSAQVRLPGTNSIHTWKLKRMEDRFENFYEVIYHTATGLVGEPFRIEYTFIGGQPKQRVQFNHLPRSDVRTSYILGRKFTLNKRLANIVVRNNGPIVRQYNLAYQAAMPISDRSRLESITECGRNSKCFPPIQIQWQSESKGYTTATAAGDKAPVDLIEYYTFTRNLGGGQTEPNSVKEINRGAWVDVNGDGRTDVVLAYTNPNGTNIYRAYLKTDTGWSANDSSWYLPKPLRSYKNSIVNTTTARFKSDVINMGQFADVNGDGLVDIVYSYKLDQAPQQYADPNHSLSDIVEVKETWINQAGTVINGVAQTGWAKETAWQPVDLMFDYISNGAGYERVETVRGRLIDLDGDGLPDWVRAFNDYNSSTSSNNLKKTWINNGNGWTHDPSYIMPDVMAHYRGRYSIPHGQFVDVNGDGLVDWVRSYHASTESAQRKTWLNTGTGWDGVNGYTLPELIYDNLQGWNDASPVTRGQFVDINGDGLVDWVRSYETVGGAQYKSVRLNTGTGWTSINTGFAAPQFVHVNHRYSTFERGWPLNIQGNYIDLNGDGLVDYAQSFKSSATGFPVEKKAWINTGSAWVEDSTYAPTDIHYDYSGRENAKSDFGRYVDINNDGSADWVVSRAGVTNYSRLKTTPRKDQLAAVVTTLGIEVKPTYQPLTAGDSVYVKQPVSEISGQLIQAAAGTRLVAGPMYVTTELKTNTATSVANAKTYNTTQYQYAGAKSSRIGRGFLGFKQVTITQLNDRDYNQSGVQSSTTKTEYYQHFPRTGMPQLSQSWTDGVLLSKTQNTYSNVAVPGVGTQFVFLDDSESWSYELNAGAQQVRRVQRSVDYNNTYGNVELDTVNVYGGPSGNETLLRTTVSNPTYFPADLTNWHLNQVSTSVTTVDDGAGGEVLEVRKVAFTYEPGFTGALKTMTRQPDATDETKLKTTYFYDTFGNVKEQHAQSYGVGAETRASKIGYGIGTGADGRLPLSTENAEGHPSLISYDSDCDAPDTITDANGNVTTITYDDFCRQKTVKAPTQVVSETIYERAGDIGVCVNCQVPPSFKITTLATGTAPVATYLNAYLQPVLSSTTDKLFNVVEQRTEYDRFGRVTRESQPYFLSDTPIYNEYQYDALNRVVETELPYLTLSGTQASIQYSYSVANMVGVPNAVRRGTTDTEGNTTYSFANALGQIKGVLDAHSKLMQYSYFNDGALKSTTDVVGNTIQVSYDDIGRRTGLDDPDMGPSSYAYNSFGEMVKHTDAKGFEKTMQYDKLGRLTQRTVPSIASDPTNSGGNSTFSYDAPVTHPDYPNQATVGAPTSVTGPNGYSQSLYYDQYGRPLASTTTIKGASLTQQMAYDPSTGFLASRAYPDSGTDSGGNGIPFKVAFEYQNGYLDRITSSPDCGDVVEHWRADQYDALGRVTQETLGDLVSTNRGFKPGQNVLESIESTLTQGAPTKVQDLAYVYDAANNVKERSDLLSSLNETFQYDNLYRLTDHLKQDGLTSSSVNVTYDHIGNIFYKSDVGTYTYGQNGAGPHAVTSIDASTATTTNLSHFEVNWEWDGDAELKALPNYTANQTAPYDGVFKYDANGSVEEIGNRNVYWTAFDKPYQMIATTANGMQGSLIEYDAQQNRVYKEEATFTSLGVKSAITEKTIYLGKDYERIEKFNNGSSQGVIHRYTIATAGNVIQIERDDGTAFDKPKYLLGDNLGSTNVILDALGQVEQRLAFDPWGMRMNVGDAGAVNKITNRGYTGHEMDDEVGLINMNARIYDPLLGRFLSADPVLPDAGDMQQFNRYSYVGNNPLSFTDPTGHSRIEHDGCSSTAGCRPALREDGRGGGVVIISETGAEGPVATLVFGDGLGGFSVEEIPSNRGFNTNRSTSTSTRDDTGWDVIRSVGRAPFVNTGRRLNPGEARQLIGQLSGQTGCLISCGDPDGLDDRFGGAQPDDGDGDGDGVLNDGDGTGTQQGTPRSVAEARGCSGQMCRAPNTGQRVSALNVDIGFPIILDGKLQTMSLNLTLGLSYSSEAGSSDPFADLSIDANPTLGLLFMSGQVHQFHGSKQQYQNSNSVSAFWGLGGSAIKGSERSGGVGLGVGFGGRWVRSIPFVGKHLNRWRNRGVEGNVNTGI